MRKFVMWVGFILRVIFSKQARSDLTTIFEDWLDIRDPLVPAPTVDPDWQRKRYAEMGKEE